MCTCITKINEKLAEHNTQISTSLTVSRDLTTMGIGLQVPTHKIDSKRRKPAMTLLATFCPFCGKKWEN